MQIVTLQIEAMQLKIRLSGEYKTQAQIDGECSFFDVYKTLIRLRNCEVALVRWSG